MPKAKNGDLKVTYTPIGDLRSPDYNPRKWSDKALSDLKESIKRFGAVDPLIMNSHKERCGIVIGGSMRLKILKDLGYKEVPVVSVEISDLEREKELNLRLNKNTGEFDLDMLSEFDESFLDDIGFISEELDEIFEVETNETQFDLKKELEKLDINEVKVEKGDIYKIGDSKVMCGDSTNADDFTKLMDGEKADMVLTDPPYILDYLKGKSRQKDGATTGFGAKKNRRYLETDELPDNFTELWMKNVSDSVKEDSHIICFENWKNLRVIWGEMEKYWKVRNMIVWHLPNRVQGFSAKYRFFNKHDIAMLGSSGEENLNLDEEESVLQNHYETALFATSGKPHWESYSKGKKYCPTDFIEFVAADEKSSGQGVIFGTKPIDILIPYVKVLTKRGDLVVEPFGGSGSTMIASLKMKRRCFLMEKVPAYTEVILKRIEKETGLKPEKIHGS